VRGTVTQPQVATLDAAGALQIAPTDFGEIICVWRESDAIQ